jgi:hypothetical protein
MNSRAKLVSLVVSSLSAALAGCSTGGQSALGMSGASAPYFIGGDVTIDRDYMDRYACSADRPLICTCDSLRWGKCRCHCE